MAAREKEDLLHTSRIGAGLVGVMALGSLVACQPTTVDEGDIRQEVSSLADATWYTSDTRVGGGVVLTAATDPGASGIAGPEGFGNGSLALTTNGQNSAKAQLFTNQFGGTSLADVSRISYQTFQHPTHLLEGGFEDGAPAINLTVDTNGTDVAGGFTTLVYEPYNSGNDVQNNVWQEWVATGAGQNWASSRVINLDCTTSSGGNPAGPPFEAPSAIATRCPGAVVLSLGVNVGSYNPNYVTAVDAIEFGVGEKVTTFDFGPKSPA